MVSNCQIHYIKSNLSKLKNTPAHKHKAFLRITDSSSVKRIAKSFTASDSFR